MKSRYLVEACLINAGYRFFTFGAIPLGALVMEIPRESDADFAGDS
ncbi:MAG TPA: hypothetical protein VEL10_09390 [Gaiellaceae bacterium]|nr:hypothetical protein [Gaiellaceae bacterium]